MLDFSTRLSHILGRRAKIILYLGELEEDFVLLGLSVDIEQLEVDVLRLAALLGPLEHSRRKEYLQSVHFINND